MVCSEQGLLPAVWRPSATEPHLTRPAVNGVGLALVIPAVSSMIADYHPPETRGRAFGMMSLTASLGGMAGAFYATNVGGTQLLGMEGWRFAFHAVAAVSLATSLFVYKLAVDPRHLYHHPSVHAQHLVRGSSGGGGGGGISDRKVEPPLTAGPAPTAGADVESQKAGAPLRVAALLSARHQILRDIASVLRVRSFQILVLQVCCPPPGLRPLARVCSALLCPTALIAGQPTLVASACRALWAQCPGRPWSGSPLSSRSVLTLPCGRGGCLFRPPDHYYSPGVTAALNHLDVCLPPPCSCWGSATCRLLG